MAKLNTKEDIYNLLSASTASAAFGAAIKTGLLWMLADRPMSGEEVSRTLGIPGKRGHYWLQYLQSLGILEEVPQGYIPSAVVSSVILGTYSREGWQHLVIDEQEENACVHGLPDLIDTPGSLWRAQGLEEPKDYVDRMRASPTRAREFTRMLFEVHQNLANQVAELLDLTGVERMLDLGGNSGVVSMALLRRYPALTSTVVDIESVCTAGREIAEEQEFSGRITYHPAEFGDDEFPSGFDLVLQCDVAVYDVGLLRKIYRSLKPGGRFILVDHFSPAINLAPPTRLEWTFLDSLHDPNFSFPTLDEFILRLAQVGFEVLDGHQILGKGLVVLQARKV
jgi:SAM-dependent methyltransferase